MEMQIDRNIYSDACVSKTIYSLANKYAVNRVLNGSVETLRIIALVDNVADEVIEKDILSALNDYKLRQIIEQETHDIRTILYAKAFADCDDLETDDV